MLTIIKKGVGTAVYEVESKREVHDPASVKYFKDRFDGASHILKGGEVQSEGGGSFSPLKSKGTLRAPEDLRYHMTRAKKNYERGCPITLDITTKNKLWSKLKVLKDRVIVGMVTKRDMHPVKVKQVGGQIRTVVDYNKLRSSKAVERNGQWVDKNEKDLKEIKRILRVLEPNGSTDILESWRPE